MPTQLNIPGLLGLLNAGNPRIGQWARAAEQWTRANGWCLLHDVSFAAVFAEYDPSLEIVPSGTARERREIREALIRGSGAPLRRVAAEYMKRLGPAQSTAPTRAQLELDPTLEGVWAGHCERNPTADLRNWPIECFNFFVALMKAPGAGFLEVVVGAVRSYENLARRLDELCYLPLDMWETLADILGEEPVRPWWRTWEEPPSDRLGEA